MEKKGERGLNNIKFVKGRKEGTIELSLHSIELRLNKNNGKEVGIGKKIKSLSVWHKRMDGLGIEIDRQTQRLVSPLTPKKKYKIIQ